MAGTAEHRAPSARRSAPPDDSGAAAGADVTGADVAGVDVTGTAPDLAGLAARAPAEGLASVLDRLRDAAAVHDGKTTAGARPELPAGTPSTAGSWPS
jgi:hypothetical protein